MNVEQLSENNCKFPCCGSATTLEALLGLSEWATRHYEIWKRPWIYFHCPCCKGACYYLAASQIVEVGYFGAAPVPDLIPIYEIAVELQVEKQDDGVKIMYADNEVLVPYSPKW